MPGVLHRGGDFGNFCTWGFAYGGDFGNFLLGVLLGVVILAISLLWVLLWVDFVWDSKVYCSISDICQ